MPPRRTRLILCCWLAFGLVGVATATARTNQGTDYDELPEIADPLNWTQVIINKGELEEDTVTFYLNPCEWIVYLGQDGRALSCLPRPACTHLDAMEEKLEFAMAVWENLADDALTLDYGGVLGGGPCPDTIQECQALGTDHWTEDGMFVVTRTYLPGFALSPQECPGSSTTPPTEGGAALSLFFDDPNDHTTRWILESDVILGARKWDNVSPDCPGDQLDLDEDDCEGAWLLELAHEIGHTLGFSHSYATRHTLDPLASSMVALDLVLQDGRPSIMSYDRRGQIGVYNEGAVSLNTYDQAVYLESYAENPDPLGDFFTASGIVADCDATPDAPLYGAAVIALEVQEVGPDTLATPVHLSLTGIHPRQPGEFRLDHLQRDRSYRLIVVDARDPNQMLPNGWDFTESAGDIPGIMVRRTDDWSVENSGNDYKREMRSQFATGFDWKLKAEEFDGFQGDYDAGTICVEFP